MSRWFFIAFIAGEEMFKKKIKNTARECLKHIEDKFLGCWMIYCMHKQHKCKIEA